MVITDSKYSEVNNNPHCPNCQEIGKLVRLKERVYLDENEKLQPLPPDNDNWLQCWKCGQVYAIHEVKKEGKIVGISGVEVIDNLFDVNKKVIKGLDNKSVNKRLNKKKKEQNKHPVFSIYILVHFFQPILQFLIADLQRS